MADFTSSHLPSETGLFQRVFDALVRLAEASPKMEAINKLNAVSDETLAAHGTTRVNEVQRILGGWVS